MKWLDWGFYVVLQVERHQDHKLMKMFPFETVAQGKLALSGFEKYFDTCVDLTSTCVFARNPILHNLTMLSGCAFEGYCLE